MIHRIFHFHDVGARPLVGASVLLLAFGCGDSGEGSPPEPGGEDPPTRMAPGGDPGTEEPPPDDGTPAVDCAATPDAEGCQPEPSNQGPPDVGESGGNEVELLIGNFEATLTQYCGSCHGADAREKGSVQGNFDFVDEYDRLLESGLVIPGDAQESLVIRRILDGTMPPPSSDVPKPTEDVLDQVQAFINNPIIGLPAAASCTDQAVITFDEIYSQIQRDVFAQDDDERPFLRYLTLTNRYNAGTCKEELDIDRWGMSKLVNMLSTETTVRAPLPIDSAQTIFRIDIRDYGWDREVEVNGVVFDDGWEAIIANTLYAVPFEGAEVETVIDETGTRIPLLYSDAFIEIASVGNLYYALVDVDVNASLNDFIEVDLGIDIEDNIEQEEVIRAGTTQSNISNQDRVTERHEIGVRQGAFWQSFDFRADEASDSIFADPFGFAAGGTEAIFTLPNGLLGFIVADDQGNIVEESDILIDRTQNDFKARTAVSCSGCHGAGLIPVRDQVRSVVEANPLDYDADTYEAVLDIYVSVDDFLRQIADDSSFYQASLSRAGVPTREADPVSSNFIRFDLDMDLKEVAGDLGISSTLLRDNLNRLDPALGQVRITTIDRDDFSALFPASLCQMQVFSQNRPEAGFCRDAIAALDD